MSPLTARAEQLLANPYSSTEELVQLQQNLLALEGDILHWDTDRPSSWAPDLVGHVLSETIEDSSYRCSGPVYKYLDRMIHNDKPFEITADFVSRIRRCCLGLLEVDMRPLSRSS